MSDFAALYWEQAEASAQVHFVYDVAAARVVFVNSAYETVLGGHREQVNDELGALLDRLHPDDRAYLAQYWKVLVRGQVTDEVEVRLLRPSQSEQTFCLTPYCSSKGSSSLLVCGTLRDISAAKSYQRNADAFNARKNATLEILSHDLGGSFAMMEQITDYLVEEIAVAADSQAAKLLQVLQNTSRNSLKLIRDLVAIEFLSGVDADLQLERVEVGAVLREPLEQLKLGQGVLGFHFAYALPPEPVYAHLDVNKFNQVLTNLVSNAFKFTPDGGQVAVQVETGPDCVRFHVRDDGVGIPAALQPHLFERFTSARRPGLRGEPTTGLGLSLCQTIVEWHRGTIAVVSAEGSGSTFTVEIPLAL
ncbi:ATP-binding protein (plasmid) [Hymenobacter tibetensis]|uniref:histidine kinase n=1 Tax=Hymenobacter tibetensis TaxID=497967 RepID=A0ABY4D5A3_9BACT|nr:ATP-binding protein [Hymenobacter tibetensis]UOG77688.1 ATP-binding protein [Hymenobacter tibetensis]